MTGHATVAAVVLGVERVQDGAGDEDLGPNERGRPDLGKIEVSKERERRMIAGLTRKRRVRPA